MNAFHKSLVDVLSGQTSIVNMINLEQYLVDFLTDMEELLPVEAIIDYLSINDEYYTTNHDSTIRLLYNVDTIKISLPKYHRNEPFYNSKKEKYSQAVLEIYCRSEKKLIKKAINLIHIKFWLLQNGLSN